MTTPHTITRIWSGETVVIFGSGPGLTPELADSLRGQYHSIAARYAFQRAPWADMLVGIDAPPNHGFWDDCKDFAGIKLCGSECDLDALHVQIPHEVVTIAPGNTVHIRNNGLAAMRIAVQAGAAKLLLVGFQPALYEAINGEYLTAGLAQITSELQAQGIVVDHLDAPQPVDEPATVIHTKSRHKAAR